IERKNTIKNSTKSGMEIRDCIGATITLKNNYLSSNASRDDLTQLAGLRFHNNTSSNILLDGNVILNNDHTGLEFETGVTENLTIRNTSLANNNILVDNAALQFRNYTSGDSSIFFENNTMINNNNGGLWFQDVYSPVYLEQTYIASNTGIGYRSDDVPTVIWGKQNYTPPASDNGAIAAGAHAGCRLDQIATCSSPGDDTANAAVRDPLTADAWTNGGGTIVRFNGSWGMQLRASTTTTNVEFHGGQFRSNGAQSIGVQNGNAVVKVYDAFFGGNSGDAVSSQGSGTILLDNVLVRGSDAVQAQSSATVTLQNYCMINQKTRANGGGIYVYNFCEIGCVNNCDVSGGSGMAQTHYFENGNTITNTYAMFGGSGIFVNHNYIWPTVGFRMQSGGSITLYDGNTMGGMYLEMNHSSSYITADPNGGDPNTINNAIRGRGNFNLNGNIVNSSDITCGDACGLADITNNCFSGTTIQSGYMGSYSSYGSCNTNYGTFSSDGYANCGSSAGSCPY
ncbi:MAG: right-handed parallel beta-helix repeat-containing protein, partial [bacterium]